MPTDQKTTPRRTTAAARARAERDARRLDQMNHTLEAAQKDLASMGSSLGTGVGDLRRDVSKMLRDARRDLTKMRRAIQRDLDHLQRDLSSIGKRPASRNGRRSAARRSGS